MTSELNIEKEKVNLETSRIHWKELQRFFAAGVAIQIGPDLDLVEVAYQFSKDNKTMVEQWLSTHDVGPVSDQQATEWIQNDREVWAVVVKPWILVQEVSG